MNKNTIKNYKEVKLDSNGHEEDRSRKNRLTKIFQYEYALYLTVSDLFESVRCRSMCVDSLKLYFMELGHKKENDEIYAGNKRKNTREDLLEEMGSLVSRDVIGRVSFPMMHICSAEVRTIPEENGTHSFVFSDGIYGFKIQLDSQGKGHPTKIEVTNLGKEEPAHGRTEIMRPAAERAA